MGITFNQPIVCAVSFAPLASMPDSLFAGTQYLADGLCHNGTLIQLHIGGNNIGDLGVTALGMLPFAQAALPRPLPHGASNTSQGTVP